MPILTGLAPAKINLGLHVLGRLADGYHEVRTVLQTISLADTVEVRYSRSGADGVTLDCDIGALDTQDNLAAKAARRLLKAGKYSGKVHIHLVKRIPIGAGLGGGSSDAAAVLMALSVLLRPAPPDELLYEVASTVGSDVPFFLVGGTAVAVGHGEEVYPLPDIQRRWLLVLVPEISIETKKAYQSLSQARRNKNNRLTAAQRQHIISGFCSSISGSDNAWGLNTTGPLLNDFENVLDGIYPELKKWKQRLFRMGASTAALSGSGSALFGVFSDRNAAIQARKSLGSFSGESYVVRTLDRKACCSVWQRKT